MPSSGNRDSMCKRRDCHPCGDRRNFLWGVWGVQSERSQPTNCREGIPRVLTPGEASLPGQRRVRGGGQARWSYYSSSTLAPSRLSSDEILYIILPSSNPSPLHPAPPCAHPCWPLGPSPRNHLPFLLPCGSFCFFFPPLASGRAQPPPALYSPHFPLLRKGPVPVPLPFPHPAHL